MLQKDLYELSLDCDLIQWDEWWMNALEWTFEYCLITQAHRRSGQYEVMNIERTILISESNQVAVNSDRSKGSCAGI